MSSFFTYIVLPSSGIVIKALNRENDRLDKDLLKKVDDLCYKAESKGAKQSQ